MTNEELLEIDRIQKIQSINFQYDLENNSYLAFSGGKDSTVLHHLLDLALPNNNIPRVFVNTGIEYQKIVEFVKTIAKNDKRIKDRIARGLTGSKLYDWWNINQIKNVSKNKSGIAHPCVMPLEVMKNIIGILPSDIVVFDPFMGSGTTGVACKELGVDFIGCDIDENYCALAQARIEYARDKFTYDLSQREKATGEQNIFDFIEEEE